MHSGVVPVFVIVSGPPGSGKTTLARPLASALSLPLIAKDTIKGALMSVLPPVDVDASRHLGRAAIAAMLAVAAESSVGAVIESNFYRSVAREELGRLPGTVIEVFCRCDERTAQRRYRERVDSRHAGHFDQLRTDDELRHPEVCDPVAGGWPVLEVDTDRPVDLTTVVAFVHAHQPTDR